MSGAEQIKVTRTVDAAPGAVFAVLADPARHMEVDGSGFLRGVVKGSRINEAGEEFLMAMKNPIMGNYEVLNRVHAYEPGRTIGWSPSLHPASGYKDKLGDMVVAGHSFTWELAPSGSGTDVTQTYDWSGVGDPGLAGRPDPLGSAAPGVEVASTRGSTLTTQSPDLVGRLAADFPELGKHVILDAVRQCERALSLFGDGAEERSTVEVTARRNLTDLSAALRRSSPAG